MHSPSPSLDREAVRSVVAVLTHLKQHETASSHNDILSAGIARLWECYDGTQFEVSPAAITPSDVERAYRLLAKHSPTQAEANAYRDNHGTPHPNRPFTHGLDFVDTASRYAIGPLPSFRSWTAQYIHDGAVIAERSYDYEDSIKLTPVIDDVRYKADATTREPDGIVRVYVSQRPFGPNIDVFIHQHTNDTVKIEAQNGPNVATDTQPVSTLEAEFDAERTGDTDVIVNEDIEDVVEFIEDQGWAYANDEELFK